MSDSIVYIYADESCLGNQFQDRSRPGAAAGLIETFDERKGWYRRDYSRFEADTTNNRMAIVSGIAGLSVLRTPCDVVFTSDSQYLVRGMKDWVHSWAKRGWKRKGGPIENLVLWQALCSVALRHRVEWRWVRGHGGHPKNEFANALAIGTAGSEIPPIEAPVPSSFDDWLEAEMEKGRYVDYLDVPPAEPFRPDPRPPV